MINPYKRLDVFRCKAAAHTKFEHRVSVFHVLRVKNCYPQGCIYFWWRCQLLNKGQSCIKNYQHVGRKCFGCKHYYDEKSHNQPQLLISAAEYQDFLDELDDFEDWLESVKDRAIDIQGTIRSVKPALTKIISHQKVHLSLNGYFLHFDQAYIDRNDWEDHCYAIVYPDQQARYQFAAGDELEFRGRVALNRGRLIFQRLHQIEFHQRSSAHTWSNSQALVAQHSIISFAEQPSKCLHCDQGMLVDVIDKLRPEWKRYRELFCLKSFPDPSVCYYAVEKRFLEEIDSCGEYDEKFEY